MTIPALQLEVKKDGFQQLQSGSYKLTVTLNPADFKDNAESLLLDFIKAPMGQIYMLGMAAVGETGEPKKPTRKPAATRAEKARRMCGIEQFQGFIFQRAPNAVRDGRGGAYQTASDGVKEICGVVTKSDLDVLPVPMKRWDALLAEYEQSVGRMAQVTR